MRIEDAQKELAPPRDGFAVAHFNTVAVGRIRVTALSLDGDTRDGLETVGPVCAAGQQ